MENFLDRMSEDRRRFVRRLAGMAAFAAPSVRSLVLTTVATESVPEVAEAQKITTTSVPTSTMATTTSSPTTIFPTTSSFPTTPFPFTTPPHVGIVPEIDPDSAVTAVAALASAILIGRSYRSGYRRSKEEGGEPETDEAKKP